VAPHGLFEGLEHVGGIVAGAALGADSGWHVLNENVISVDLAGYVHFLLADRSAAVFTGLILPEIHGVGCHVSLVCADFDIL